MDRTDCDEPTLDEMYDSFIEQLHVPLQHQLTRVREQLAQTARGHSAQQERICVAVAQLTDQVESHLSKERHLLFPEIEALLWAQREHRPRPASPFVTLLYPIRMLESEHVRIEASLRDLHDLARAGVDADDAEPAWQQIVGSLRQLDSLVRKLHRAESQQLFPMILDCERRNF